MAMIPHTSPTMLRVLACLDASLAVAASLARFAFSAFRKNVLNVNSAPHHVHITLGDKKSKWTRRVNDLVGGHERDDSQRQTAAHHREDGPRLVGRNLKISAAGFHHSRQVLANV